MSHQIVVDYAAIYNAEVNKMKRNKNKILNNCKKELEKILCKYDNDILNSVKEELQTLKDMLWIEDEKKSMDSLKNLNISISKTLINNRNIKKEIKTSDKKIENLNETIISNFEFEMKSILNENEIGILKNKFDKLEKIKLKQNLSENELNKELEELKNEIDKLLSKYDQIISYIKSLEDTGYKLEEFNFDFESEEFYVYASKDGKTFDCRSDNKKIRFNFEGYEGDECLEEFKKVKEIADRQYNLSMDIVDYVGKKPINKYKDAVNKNVPKNK